MNTVKENQRYFSNLGMRYFLGSIIIYIAQVLCIQGISHLAPAFYEKNAFLLGMIPMYVIGIPAMIFLISQIPAQPVEEKKKMKPGQFICFFLVCYAGMYLSNIIGNILAGIIGAIKGGSVNNAILDIASSNNVIVNVVILAICAPIVEEIVFRKLLIDRTIQYGDKFAIILSGLLFGFFHGNIYQFCYAFVMGVIFAYIYTKYHNIIYSILLHMAINFLNSVVAMSIVKASGIMDIQAAANDQASMTALITEHAVGLCLFGVYLLCVVAMVISGVVIFFVNKKKIVLNPATCEIEKGDAFKTLVCNIGMGLFFFFWIVMIVYQAII